MKREFFCLTHPGLVRGNNEDAVAALPDVGLALLADGMGGYNAGEIASAMAIDYTGRQLAHGLAQSPSLKDTRRLMQSAIDTANLAIYEAARNNPDYRGMGTTLVMLAFGDSRVVVGHIGDSRAYRMRQGHLQRLTKDHSLLQEHMDAGLLSPAMAEVVHYKNLVTRAMGVDASVPLELSDHAVQDGDLYLLCSDGLSDMLSDADIAELLSMGNDMASVGRLLVDAANDAGGRDNISVVLVECHLETTRPGLLTRLFTSNTT
ncbi:MAG: hypothetical protein RJA09_2651 [Pseudomonadota bacterium]|jgi:protein phosphatase